jgi:hypothetical protein
MARTFAVWTSAVVFAAAGSISAHVVGDLLGASPDGDGAESAGSGHLLAGAAPLLAGVVVALILALAVTWIAGRLGRNGRGHGAWFPVLPMIAFLLQEMFERASGWELLGFDRLHDPSAVTGLLVQVPFVVGLIWLGRLLLGAVRSLVGRLIRGSPGRAVRRSAPASGLSVARSSLPRIALLALGYPQRGPPLTAA